MSESPFTERTKIELMASLSTTAICALLGAIAGLVGSALGWTLAGMLTLSLSLTLLFLLTPLAGLLRGWVRRKAESYYYGI